jgi:hypothetical protein
MKPQFMIHLGRLNGQCLIPWTIMAINYCWNGLVRSPLSLVCLVDNFLICYPFLQRASVLVMGSTTSFSQSSQQRRSLCTLRTKTDGRGEGQQGHEASNLQELNAMPPAEFRTELHDSLTHLNPIWPFLQEHPQESRRWGTSRGHALVQQVCCMLTCARPLQL